MTASPLTLINPTNRVIILTSTHLLQFCCTSTERGTTNRADNKNTFSNNLTTNKPRSVLIDLESLNDDDDPERQIRSLPSAASDEKLERLRIKAEMSHHNNKKDNGPSRSELAAAAAAAASQQAEQTSLNDSLAAAGAAHPCLSKDFVGAADNRWAKCDARVLPTATVKSVNFGLLKTRDVTALSHVQVRSGLLC
jgi:hypothetical protein